VDAERSLSSIDRSKTLPLPFPTIAAAYLRRVIYFAARVSPPEFFNFASAESSGRLSASAAPPAVV